MRKILPLLLILLFAISICHAGFETDKLGIIEGGALPTFDTYIQGGDQAGDITYTLPTANTDGFLKNTAGVWSWDTGSGLFHKLDGSTTGILNATTIYNSLGNLKIMPDVQGDVGLFGDTDVANGTDGRVFSVNRRAAEGDTYLNFYINDDQVAYIDSNWDISIRSNLASGVIELGAISTNIVRLIGTVNAIGEPSGTENLPLRHYGYITADAAQRYITWDLQDGDDWFHLSRSDTNILGFKIEMPVDLVDNSLTTTGTVTIGNGTTGTLDLTGLVADVSLFDDITVADDADGKALYIRRHAAEGDNYYKLNITQYRVGSFYVDNNMLFSVREGEVPYKFYLYADTFSFNEYGNATSNGVFKQFGYITADATKDYIQWKINDATDNFELTKSGANLGSFDIQMPLITDDITAVGTVAATTITGANVTSGADPGHTHTGGSLSGIDISDDTNLAVTTPITLTGDSVGMVNQGTTTTVLHGNAAGNPAFSAVTYSDITAMTSANFAGLITNETGSASGSPLVVFNVNPTLTGATIPTTSQLIFRDAAIYIYSSVDGYLNLVADTGVEINSPLLNLTNLYAAGKVYADHIGEYTGAHTIYADNTITASVGIISGSAVRSDADSTDTCGASSQYWLGTYTDTLYLNSTATWGGGTAGVLTGTGALTCTLDIGLVATKKIYLDGVARTGNTYLFESSADVFDIYAGGANILKMNATTATFVAGAVVNFDHISETTASHTIVLDDTLSLAAAKGMPDFKIFEVQQAKVGHFGATAAKIEGGLNRWCLLFDPDVSDQFADYQFIMPFTYTAQTLTVKLMWTDTVANNNVVWNAALMAMTSGDAALLETDSFDTVNATTTAASATIGRPVTTSITMTNKDSVAAGDICTLRISRDADNASDTNTGVAQIAGLIMEWN